jgi:hypothetical protein
MPDSSLFSRLSTLITHISAVQYLKMHPEVISPDINILRVVLRVDPSENCDDILVSSMLAG